MAKTKDQAWTEATAELLSKLDIAVEYELLGLKLSASRARPTGWLPCHAMGRDDNSPSAEINVGEGPARGRYRDFGGGDGQTLSLWEFAARFGGPSFGNDWRTARRHFATKAGVDLPKGKEDDVPADAFEFYPLTPGALLTWCAKKPGITAKAVLDCGGIGARWPRTAPAELQQHLIAFPAFGSGLLDLPPCGYHSVAASGGKIRVFKGKGVEPDALKTMQKGPPGLLGVGSLRRLAEAKVVWIVEGITDLLAITSAIGDTPGHVAITSGGASYRPQAEWMQHFAGKTVIVCFDCDRPGQTGAAIWASALVVVPGCKVRKLTLPYEIAEDHGKDLRDYLTDGHAYADLWSLAEVAPILDPDDKASLVKPHQGILEALGIVVSGQINGTDHVEIFSQKTNKKTLIRDVHRWQIPHMILALGPEVVDEYISDSLEPQPTKYKPSDVRNAIAAEASDKPLSSEQALGVGIWPVGHKLVLVGARSADCWNGSKELEQVHLPAVDGQRLDFGSDEWYDRVKLGQYLAYAADPAWCKRVMHEASALFDRWDNWKTAVAPDLLAGLVCASWIQTCWELRPMVSILGPTNTGKSMLIEGTLHKLWGKLSLSYDNVSESAIRQRVGSTAKILSIDEFDSGKMDRQGVLDLLRSSTRGRKAARGSNAGGQKGLEFSLKHIVWLSSIELGLNKEADRNRFIVLELKRLPEGRPAQLTIPTPAELADLGMKLLAATIRHWEAMVNLATNLKRRTYVTSGRLVEAYAAPVAAWATLCGLTDDERDGMMNACLADRIGSSDVKQSDEERLLRELYESTVLLPRGVKVTVSDLLKRSTITDGGGDPVVRADVLRSVGLKHVAPDSDEGGWLFVNQTVAQRELLKAGYFQGLDINQILMRIPGAERCQQRMGNHVSRGVQVPMATIESMIGGCEDEEPAETF